MKKVILSLILTLMLLPIASVFSACGGDKGYNLNNLQKDFTEIATVNNNVIFDDGKLKFDYSNHSEITDLIESNYPSLEKYNFVFENSTVFISAYIDECSNNKSTNNVELKNNINNSLKEFSLAVRDVNECFDMFSEYLYENKENPRAENCVERFENLIYSYEKAYSTAGNLSNNLSNLYFNYVLKDGNPNVAELGIENFASTVIIKFESRLKYQISNLTQCFVEKYVGGDMANKIAHNQASFNLDSNSYKTNVESLTKPIVSIDAAVQKAEANKETFYNLAVQAQNFQSALNNDQNKFVLACNSIEYVVVNSNENKTPIEELNIAIINSNDSLVLAYNSVLSDMLDVITNT